MTLSAEFGHADEGVHILQLPAARLNDQIIAAKLAFSAHTAADPPHGRMEEQQRLDDSLKQVHHQIEAADMCQFMADDGSLLRTVEPG